MKTRTVKVTSKLYPTLVRAKAAMQAARGKGKLAVMYRYSDGSCAVTTC